jgi:hypothetical protein
MTATYDSRVGFPRPLLTVLLIVLGVSAALIAFWFHAG